MKHYELAGKTVLYTRMKWDERHCEGRQYLVLGLDDRTEVFVEAYHDCSSAYLNIDRSRYLGHPDDGEEL